MTASPVSTLSGGPQTLPVGRFGRVRGHTVSLAAPLSAEDCAMQSMPDASPVKWHLAHTSWFFEQFVLAPHRPGYTVFDRRFAYLFNSYYESVGPRHERSARGLLTRPSLAEVLSFRRHVDEAMTELLAGKHGAQFTALVELGLQHEQQHQELILMDVKHLLSCNPLKPAYSMKDKSMQEISTDKKPRSAENSASLHYLSCPEGIYEMGHSGHQFCFDNETPRHRVYLDPYAVADRLVTNGEYREFVRDGGYRRSGLWSSDGWQTAQTQDWSRPLYWDESLDVQFTLHGMQPLELDSPVSHVSFYEADAFARWAQARLPTEAEWEVAADKFVWGELWEHTNSAHLPYPGYKQPAGAIGEYNGKFMVNQMVLRGASSATPAGHARRTYRNFFYPHMRWQFCGIRLAKDSR